MVELGQKVSTPDGKTGRVAAPNTGGKFSYYKLSETDLNNPVYAVFMDDGEVRHYQPDALTPVDD